MPIYNFKDKVPDIVYLDTSFLINILVADAKYYQECLNYSEKLKQKNTIMLLSILGLDELWYIRLKLSAIDFLKKRDKENPEKKWFWFLKENSEYIKNFSQLAEEDLIKLLQINNLFLIEITKEQMIGSLELMKKYALFPKEVN